MSDASQKFHYPMMAASTAVIRPLTGLPPCSLRKMPSAISRIQRLWSRRVSELHGMGTVDTAMLKAMRQCPAAFLQGLPTRPRFCRSMWCPWCHARKVQALFSSLQTRLSKLGTRGVDVWLCQLTRPRDLVIENRNFRHLDAIFVSQLEESKRMLRRLEDRYGILGSFYRVRQDIMLRRDEPRRWRTTGFGLIVVATGTQPSEALAATEGFRRLVKSRRTGIPSLRSLAVATGICYRYPRHLLSVPLPVAYMLVNAHGWHKTIGSTGCLYGSTRD